MKKGKESFQWAIITLFILISFLNLGQTAIADDTDDQYASRGSYYPYMQINTTYLELRPGENAICEAFVYMVQYSDQPHSVWMWITEAPEGWTVSLNRTYFPEIDYEKVNTTLSISVPSTSPVGIEEEIEVGGNWSDGNWTQTFVPEQVTVKVLGPDLSVSPSGILIPERDYQEGQRVPVLAQINNTGDIETSNISVRFLVDGEPFGKEHLIENLAPGKLYPVIDEWRAVQGNHIISVEIDYRNSIEEYDEINNAAAININVDEKPFYWEYVFFVSIGLFIAVIFIWRIKRGNDVDE